MCVWQSELTEFFAELTEFAPKLSEAQWVLLLSKQQPPVSQFKDHGFEGAQTMVQDHGFARVWTM